MHWFIKALFLHPVSTSCRISPFPPRVCLFFNFLALPLAAPLHPLPLSKSQLSRPASFFSLSCRTRQLNARLKRQKSYPVHKDKKARDHNCPCLLWSCISSYSSFAGRRLILARPTSNKRLRVLALQSTFSNQPVDHLHHPHIWCCTRIITSRRISPTGSILSS